MCTAAYLGGILLALAVQSTNAITHGAHRGAAGTAPVLEAFESLDAGDPVSGRRTGRILRKKATNTWGEPPYPIQVGDYQGDLPDLAPSQGQIFTDDSENGNHIRKVLLDMHNYVRKLEAPAAQYMNKLVWDFHLEAYSRQWATYLCQNRDGSFFDHSPDVSTGIPAWPFRITTGENLYTSSSNRPKDDDFSDVVQKWYNEGTDFDWSTGQAKPGATQPVGHWKQLVRPQATSVGCTVVSGCHADGGSSSWKTYVACQYDYGNLSPLPYDAASGGVCTQCPAGMSCCEQGLCAGQIPANATGLSPYGPAAQKFDTWYSCENHKRSNCDGTGAATFTEKLDNDPYNLEFNQCHCGLGPSPKNFKDTVQHGYFWFRNRCYQLTQGSWDQLDDTNSITSLLGLAEDVLALPVKRDALRPTAPPPPAAQSQLVSSSSLLRGPPGIGSQ